MEALSTSARAASDFQRTIQAYDQLIRLDPNNAEWRVRKYEAYVAMAEGRISPAARITLIDLLETTPDHPAGQFYLGQWHVQNDRPEEARQVWQSLLERSDAAAPWVPAVRRK